MNTIVIEVCGMLSVLSAYGVEKRIGKLPGVKSVTVNFVAGSATVRYDETRVEVADIKAAVHRCGYESAGESLPRHVSEHKPARKHAVVPTPEATPGAQPSTPIAALPKAAPVAPAAPAVARHEGHAAPHAHDAPSQPMGGGMRPHEARAATPGDTAMPIEMAHSGGAVWPYFANMTLGLWLITGAFALGLRSSALQATDVASGALVILLAALSLSRRPFWKLWAPWANSLVGLWLLFAPLAFWAPTAAAYSNDTLVGALVVVFAIPAPGMPMAPGMSMEPGPAVPPGWSYNPSSWTQRAPIIALALIGFFLSRQMTAFQLGYVATLTDPLFGIGSSVC
jgi:copper chaperone CopZ